MWVGLLIVGYIVLKCKCSRTVLLPLYFRTIAIANFLVLVIIGAPEVQLIQCRIMRHERILIGAEYSCSGKIPLRLYRPTDVVDIDCIYEYTSCTMWPRTLPKCHLTVMTASTDLSFMVLAMAACVREDWMAMIDVWCFDFWHEPKLSPSNPGLWTNSNPGLENRRDIRVFCYYVFHSFFSS